jgi:hypothetical protein
MTHPGRAAIAGGDLPWRLDALAASDIPATRSCSASRPVINRDQAGGGVVFVAETQLCAHALKRDRHDADRFGLESCNGGNL